MKRIYAIMTVLALCGWNTTQAQNVETEITVTDKGKEEVIELPQGMITEVDSLLHLYNTKTYMKPATDCNVPNVNPIYTKEEYMERLKRIPSVIEMPYNDIVQKFIDRYSSRLRRSVSYMLGAQNFYMPIFEQALETYGLPLELKYLPVIESALNPKAVSRVGATGLWQFMLKTGKNYGLEVNSLVDERRDPVKASYAAARYLSDLSSGGVLLGRVGEIGALHRHGPLLGLGDDGKGQLPAVRVRSLQLPQIGDAPVGADLQVPGRGAVFRRDCLRLALSEAE